MIDQNIRDIIKNQDPNKGMDQLFFTNKALFDLSYEACLLYTSDAADE